LSESPAALEILALMSTGVDAGLQLNIPAWLRICFGVLLLMQEKHLLHASNLDTEEIVERPQILHGKSTTQVVNNLVKQRRG
jgi:hypothetical protein